jgi:hypothetical protein
MRWFRGVDNYKWTTLRVVWSMDKEGRQLVLEGIKINSDKSKRVEFH